MRHSFEREDEVIAQRFKETVIYAAQEAMTRYRNFVPSSSNRLSANLRKFSLNFGRLA